MLSKRFCVHPAFCIGLCVSLFVLPVQWVAAWFAAAAIHELGHLLALRLLRVPILRIVLRLNGIYIDTGYMTAASELLSALAGPAFGLMCLCLSSRTPYLAVCAFAQNAFNLLPFPDFDGGRILLNLLILISPDRAEPVYRWIVNIVSVILPLLGIILWICVDIGPLIFLLCAVGASRTWIRKIPCKQCKQIVQ